MGLTVLRKIVKDQMETQLKDRQRPSTTLSDPKRPANTELLRVAEIETNSIPATLKDPQQKQNNTLSDPERPTKTVYKPGFKNSDKSSKSDLIWL